MARIYPIFSALLERFQEPYSGFHLRADFMAGTVVAMVAIPLSMALAIASGVSPQHGLYTAIIAGFIVALLGGSRFQVTGPTAAFVVILAPIAEKFGIGGLFVAGMMAGLLLIFLGIAKMGRLIQFIPYPVTTGFTAGIALVIATLQLKDFFGLQIKSMPDYFFGKVTTLFSSFSTFSPPETFVGILTLLFLILWPKVNKKIPAPLVVLTVVSILAAFVKNKFPQFEIETIGTRFQFMTPNGLGYGIPQTLPHFAFPWSFAGAHGNALVLSFDLIRALAPSAFAIAMLGAIESLISAVVADGMAYTKHNPNAELIALGVGNILCPFFGGIAATGAIARTATNIRFGAQSPLSAIIHSLLILAIVLLFSPYVSYLPMSSLAALLLLVAYNMSQLGHFLHILKVASRSDVGVLLICFFLTVIFDMVIGITAGIVFAALLFMQRMSSITTTKILAQGEHPHITESIPHDVVVYQISGPLFFGAAEKAVETLESITDHTRSVIFAFDNVPVMDITGLVALESAIYKLTRHDRKVYLAHVSEQPADLIKKSNLLKEPSKVELCSSLREAIQKAKNFEETPAT